MVKLFLSGDTERTGFVEGLDFVRPPTSTEAGGVCNAVYSRLFPTLGVLGSNAACGVKGSLCCFSSSLCFFVVFPFCEPLDSAGGSSLRGVLLFLVGAAGCSFRFADEGAGGKYAVKGEAPSDMIFRSSKGCLDLERVLWRLRACFQQQYIQ